MLLLHGGPDSYRVEALAASPVTPSHDAQALDGEVLDGEAVAPRELVGDAGASYRMM
jgi:hypothetical protein